MLRRALLCFLLLAAFPLVAQAGPAPAATATKPTVTLETSLGRIVVELYPDRAPQSVANFLRYVHESFYDNLIFHRVIDGFVIQTGGFAPGLDHRLPTHPAIANEATNGLANQRGTLAMARTWQVDSATSQFFINLRDNPNLDHRGNAPTQYGYAVFGRVVEGMDVVDAIARQPTTTKGQYQDVPVEDVVLLKASANRM